MKKIVGIDFGTTNVRVSQWDVDSNASPSISLIGGGNTTTMPAVIAFLRQPGGDVITEVGEVADGLTDGEDTQVIRNIKRWILGSDPYFHANLEWHLEQKDESWPTWWHPGTTTIRLWNETVTVFAEDALRKILKDAISRAGLVGAAAEWRAGCPVSSDLTYRKALVSALADLGCAGKVQWITEEPSLLCVFGKAIGSLQDGSYMVYDMGGGSFDCAVIEVKQDEITVLAHDSVPTLGGMNIDDALREQFRDEPLRSLRIAKEQLTSTGSVPLSGVSVLTMEDVEAILEEEAFRSKTVDSMLRAYRNAKLWWKRDRHSGAPPIGEYLAGNSTVHSLGKQDMARDIDEVLLVGGPTQLPYFSRKLGEVFGEEKIITTRDLSLRAGTANIPDVALTALSYGACHMKDEQYTPRTVERVPATITFNVTDGDSEGRYEAFTGLPCCSGCTRPWTEHLHPMAPYEGEWVAIPPLRDRSRTKRYSYTVSIETPDGDSLLAPITREMRLPAEYTRPRADRARLIVDRLGRVWMELEAGTVKPSRDYVLIAQEPPWAVASQRNLMREQYDIMRTQYESMMEQNTNEGEGPKLEKYRRLLEAPLGASRWSTGWSRDIDLTLETGYRHGRRA